MKSIRDWYNILSEMTADTEYEAIMKDDISSSVVAIVPKHYGTPQRIAIYPKKTKNSGLVIEQDVFEMSGVEQLLGEPTRVKSNRPHYNGVSDDVILAVCNIFLHKDITECVKTKDAHHKNQELNSTTNSINVAQQVQEDSKPQIDKV